MSIPKFKNLEEAMDYCKNHPLLYNIETCTSDAAKLMIQQSDLELIDNKELKDIVKNSKTTRDGLYSITKILIEKHHIKTVGEEKPEIFIYKDGIYCRGKRVIMAEIQDILQEICTRNRVEEILSMIKNMTVTERNEFQADKYLINLENGILNIKTGRLEKHNPKHFFFTKIPVVYDQKAVCPKIDKVLGELLSKENTNLIYQWLGYSLFKDYFIKKAMIFVGEKDTGKSTILKIFHKFMGSDNVSGVSLQQIGQSFAMASLYNRSINIVDDLSFDDVNNNGAFKTVTGNGMMTAEYKFGNRFNFINYSKLTFACNKIPNIKDTNDEAYFIRWIIVRFDSLIEHKNKLLLEEILTPEEMSGLLNKALEGLDYLFSEQDFSYNKNAEDIKNEMMISGSSIAQFCYEQLEHEDNEWITKDQMYETYANFCHENKLPVETKEMLGRKIRGSASYIIESRVDITESAKKETIWRNVKFKE